MTTVVLQPDAAAGKDTFIHAGNQSGNYGIADFLQVSGPASTRKILIQFDLSSIPAEVEIISAELMMQCHFADGEQQPVTIHRSLVQWYEGDGWGAIPTGDGSTWTHRNANGSVPWAGGLGGAAGSDYAATPTDSQTITTTGPYTWDVTTDVQAFVDGAATNYGWWLLQAEGLSNDFRASDYGTASARPKLTIEYEVPGEISGGASGCAAVSGTLSHNVQQLTLQPDGAAGQDTYIFRGEPNWNYGAVAWFTAGGWTPPDAHPNKGLIRFDLSAIPAGAQVLSAELRLRCVLEESTADYGVALHRGLVEWYEGDVSGPGGVPGAGKDASTWNHRNVNGAVAWAGGAGGVAGTEYASTPTDSQLITGVGFHTWNVTDDVQAFVDGSHTNHGWWLIGDTTGDSAKIFATSDTATAGNRPRLVVLYLFPIEGTVAGSAAASGSLSGIAALTGSAAGSVMAVGDLTDPGLMRPLPVVGVSTASGTLQGRAYAAGEAEGQAALAAHLMGRAELTGLSVGSSLAVAVGTLRGLLRGGTDGAAVVSGLMWGKAIHVAPNRTRMADPLLYLTDGESRFDLLSSDVGYRLCHWTPAVAQYKGGGTFADSPMADGRRLVMRRFANAIEVMELTATGRDQDQLIRFTSELLRWLEAAADYWSGRWVTRPIYLVAKSAYEAQTRYAIVHMGSVPELEDPYDQPFFTSRGQPTLGDITLRLERGPWLDHPPSQAGCAAVSSLRNWTVQGWTSSDTGGNGGGAVVDGNVYALIQADDGAVLLGTSDGAKIYRSTDEGSTWALAATLGSGGDTVHAFARDYRGALFAAVAGRPSASGVWLSTNHGVSWTRVKTHPAGTGYTDVAFLNSSYLVVATGYGADSPAQSPVAAYNGAVWSDVAVSAYTLHHKAAAADDLPSLITAPPGLNPEGPEIFVGTDSYYTQTYRVFRPDPASAKALPSGQMGSGGLDMVAYGYTDNIGRRGRRALWAVKSHRNINDTEIWQWPDPAAGSFPAADRFGKIATMPGVIFHTLYLDPTPDHTSEQRTIWAGADAAIYVSYNSGYSWSLATSAPNNAIRAFVRTRAGRLIAGGDGGEVFLFDGSNEGGGGEAGGSEVVNTQTLGRGATCENEVFVANKGSFTNVTHIKYYSGVYSDIQFATEPPYAFLGDPPGNGHLCYFGCRTDDPNVPHGTFSSLVFELTRPASDITVVWEFWNGSMWKTLTVQDGTDGFRVQGVASVHWIIPDDWATTDVDGVTGYWVRVRVTSRGSNPVGPIHNALDVEGKLRSDRYIYTVNLGHVQVAEEMVTGDLPAIGQIKWTNRADAQDSSVDLEVHRLLVGLRSYSRGRFFDAYLNLSDQQLPFGITITAVPGMGGFEDHQRAPTGRCFRASVMGSGSLNQWHELVRLTLSTTVARDYFGDFRVFLRGTILDGDEDDWRFRLGVRFGSGGLTTYSKTVYAKPTQVDWRLFDLGSIRVPNTVLGSNQVGDQMALHVEGYATATGVTAKLYDLILIPTDEWAGDFLHGSTSDSRPSGVRSGGFLDIDSVTNPKNDMVAYNRTDGGLVKGLWQPITNGPVMLQARTRQRLWFLAATYDFDTRSYGAYPEAAGTVQVNKVQKYLGLRGNG